MHKTVACAWMPARKPVEYDEIFKTFPKETKAVVHMFYCGRVANAICENVTSIIVTLVFL